MGWSRSLQFKRIIRQVFESAESVESVAFFALWYNSP